MSIYTQIAKNRAKAEIYSILAKEMRISTKQMDTILAKHGVRRDPEALQRAYRLSVGQQMVADVRDEDGKREVLASRANGETEYIVLEACNDPQKLNEIQHRLKAQISGLVETAQKVDERSGTLQRFIKRLHFPFPDIPHHPRKPRKPKRRK